MLILIVLTSLIDILGLATFIPVISVVVDQDFNPEQYTYFQILYRFGIIDKIGVLKILLFVSAFFFIFRAVFVVWSNWVQRRFIQDIEVLVGGNMYRYYLSMDYLSFHELDSSETFRDLTTNPRYFAQFVVMNFLLLFSETLVILLIVAGLIWYDYKIFVFLCLTLIPAIAFYYRLVRNKLKAYGEEQNYLNINFFRQAKRLTDGYVDAILRRKEKYLLYSYEHAIKSINRIVVRTSTLAITPTKIIELLILFGLIGILSYGIYSIGEVEMVIPLLVLYAAAAYRLLPSLSKVLPSLQTLDTYQFLFGIYENAIRMAVKSDSTPSEQEISFEKSIDLVDVSFNHKGAISTLEKINFAIPKSSVIGLYGPSGSGKTTLANILVGFIKPNSGELRIDGIRIDSSNVKEWQKHIGYVQQEPYIEQGSLTENIAFLEKEVDEGRLQRAIRLASLVDFLHGRNPNEVILDENGKNLSGGQRQRIAIARAIYFGNDVLLLDEATSALDSETQSEIIETIGHLKQSGYTIILISHRKSVFVHCDRIYQVEKGTLREAR